MKLIAIEGGDGAGKRTLTEALSSRLAEVGKVFHSLSFPAYHSTLGGNVVGEVLNGSRPRPEHQIVMSLMFSADRFEVFDRLGSKLQEFEFVIVDRYVASNAAYHSAIVARSFDWECIKWIYNLEIEMLRLPLPALNIFLDTDADTSRRRQALKNRRNYTARKEDLFEQDRELQEIVRNVYKDLAETDLFGPWLVLNSRSCGSEVASEILADEILSRVCEI